MECYHIGQLTSRGLGRSLPDHHRLFPEPRTLGSAGSWLLKASGGLTGQLRAAPLLREPLTGDTVDVLGPEAGQATDLHGNAAGAGTATSELQMGYRPASALLRRPSVAGS